MPCNDDGRIPVPDAALCAIIRVFVKRGTFETVLAEIDWQEAGVTEDELYRWWSDHKAADQRAPRVW